MPALGSKTRFLVAFAATVLLGASAIAIANLGSLNSQTGQTRPTTSPSRGYELTWTSGAATPSALKVGLDGGGCETLGESDYLYRVCVLATNVDPAVIAGEAFGRINVEPTPALEALIWRAVLGGDRSVCEGGGLAGSSLETCERAVEAGFRRATDSGVTVEIKTEGPPS